MSNEPEAHIDWAGGLDADLLPEIIRLLDGVSVAYMSAVCKQWHAAVAGDDTIWRALLHTEFRETGLCGPDGQQCVKYHEKYKLWMQEHNQYGDVARRVRWAWGKIHHALQRDLPEALETLYPGLSEAELDAFEAEMNLRLPPTLRMMYRVHNGQRIPERTPIPTLFYGVFGSYAFYDHVVSMYMMRLHQGAELPVLGFASSPSPWCAQRVLAVDRSGMPTVLGPTGGYKMIATADKGTPYLLQWLEAYANALDTYKVCIMPILTEYPTMRGINLFPQQALPEATTQGVVVRVSTLIAPEVPSHSGYLVAYSVRFSMLPNVPGMESCQLRSRRWRIMNDEGRVVDTVEGEGVVGQYPLLRPGAPEIEYRSCSQQVNGGGWMEGEFEFVPGTLANPEGEPFWVACPRFSLGAPQVMF